MNSCSNLGRLVIKEGQVAPLLRGGTTKKGQVRRTTVRLQLVTPLLWGGTKKKGQVRRTTVSLHPSTCRWSVEVYVSQDPDECERYAPNTYRCIHT
jgi:hypothetical protein